MFRRNSTESFVSFIKGITSQQSRTLLLVGDRGWGKTACALDIAELILKQNPLTSSDFFCFRNDEFLLKTEFFLTKKPNTEEAWTWLYLLQRRINIIPAIEETLTITSVKLPALKEQFNEYIVKKEFPQDKKFIEQLIQVSQALDKKSNIPINVVREAISFHSVKSEGRVSVLSDFDMAEPATQNAALKLLEEPYPNHWLILTAQSEKNLLPTIVSRTLKIDIKKPLSGELSFLGEGVVSSIDIMKESVYNISNTKIELLQEFFTKCATSIERGVEFVHFSEKLGKENRSLLFLNELICCLEDGLRMRQSTIRNINIPTLYPQYNNFSVLFSKVSVAELEEIVSQIELLKSHISRSVIKDEYLLPKLLLDISRILKKTQ